MKLVHATIYGFGKWIDYSIDLSSESAICIYGENESGKSTLQKFILFMLFGLPPKKRSFYRPKTSGKMGGKLQIYDPVIGNYTIERLDEVQNGAVTCYTNDGMTHDETWLKERLQGMTYQTYQAIFSFSALDLNQVQEMKEDDLGEVLLGIGLSGSNNIYAIEKKIDVHLGELFKPYGKKPVINQRLESLEALFSSLNRLKSEETSYRDKQETAARLNDKIEQLQITLKKEKSHRFEIEKQLHAVPTIRDYQHYTERLQVYPESITFPENGLDRLEKAKEKLLPLESELAVLKNNEKRYREKMDTLKAAQTEDKIYKEAVDITRQQQTFVEIKKSLEKVEVTSNKLTLQINTEIDQLHIGLEQTDLATIHFPFHIENTWQQLKKDTDQLKLEKDQLKQEENELKHQRNYLLNQIQELDDGLLSEEQIQQLRDQVNQYKEFDVLTKIKSESEQRERTWKNRIAKQEKNSRISLIAAIILSIVAGITAISFKLPWLHAVMIAFLIVGTGTWVWSRYTIKGMEEMLSSTDPQLNVLQITKEEKEKAERSIADYEQNRTAYKALKEREKTRDIQYIKWTEKKRTLEEKEKRLYEQIDKQVKTYPFLQYADVAFWPEIYHRMQRLLDVYETHKETVNEAKQLKDKLDQYKAKVIHLLQQINKYNAGQSWENQLEIIAAQQANDEETKQQISQYESLRIEAGDQQRDIEQKMLPYKKEKNDLLASAQVNTEDAYYEKANQLEEKQEIIKALEKLRIQLDSILPGSLEQCFHDNETDENKLTMDRQQTIESIDETEQQIEAARQELAEVNAALLNMEDSESYSETIHQYAMEKEQLNKLAKEWAVLKTAKEMLAETMRIYRDKYLNKVIEATSAYFRHLTGNGYQTVYAPVGDQPFQVETNDAIRYTINELSQGTVDQLYVSLRMAISEIMSEKHRLPFIIDDAFVHFDAVRTKRVMEIVESIGEKQQIIIFTCKKEVTASTKHTKVIQLADGIRINE